jgi:ABC-type transport system substrate-binding protein
MEKGVTASDTQFMEPMALPEVPEKWEHASLLPRTLIFGSAGDVDKLDPGDITDQESSSRADNIFEGLVEYKEGSTEIQPCLATSWDIPADGIGEAIQGYLEDVNIHVDIYQIDWATYLAKTQAGERSLCLLGWTGDNGDPDNFMNVLYGANQCTIGTAGNVAFYNNSEVKDLFTAAVETYDITERAELYKEAEVIIHEDAPFVYLAHANQHLVLRSTVKGYIMNPAGRMFFYPVEIEEVPQESVRAFIFGKIANLSSHGEYITFER